MDGWMDGWRNRWMDGWIDMDGWMDHNNKVPVLLFIQQPVHYHRLQIS